MTIRKIAMTVLGHKAVCDISEEDWDDLMSGKAMLEVTSAFGDTDE